MLNGSKGKRKKCKVLEEQVWEEQMVEDLKKAPRKSQKRKSPGITKVPNFWFNAFDSIHRNVTNCFNKAIKNPETNPKWFTQDITFQLLEWNETNKLKNDRPITCLSTMYQMLKSIITEITYSFLDTNNILPA